MLLTRPAFICVTGTILGIIGWKSSNGVIQHPEPTTSSVIRKNRINHDNDMTVVPILKNSTSMILAAHDDETSTFESSSSPFDATNKNRGSKMDDPSQQQSALFDEQRRAFNQDSFAPELSSTKKTKVTTTMIHAMKNEIPEKTYQFITPPIDSDNGYYDPNYYINNTTPFGGILRGELPASVLYETNHLLAFQDTHPRAPLHGLIIPKRRILSVLQLSSSDLPMLYEMKQLAQQIVTIYAPESIDNTTSNNYRFVFHIPPFYSVKHLHLHVLAPVSSMSWFYRQFKYPSNEIRWCTHLDTVIDRLERGQKPVPYHVM